MGLEAQGPHVRIGNLLPRLVARGIQERLDFESAPGGGAANEVHHRFETDQRPRLPVQADEREEAMLDLVPLARARWVMADDDRESQMVRETLQVNFPRPQPVPVAASRIGADQQASGLRVRLPPQQSPPAPDTLHRELRG